MSHPHHWRLDQKGHGVCAIPGCGEERQFTANTWDVKQSDPLGRLAEDVRQEVAALAASYRIPWIKPPRARYSAKDSRLRQK